MPSAREAEKPQSLQMPAPAERTGVTGTLSAPRTAKHKNVCKVVARYTVAETHCMQMQLSRRRLRMHRCQHESRQKSLEQPRGHLRQTSRQ